MKRVIMVLSVCIGMGWSRYVQPANNNASSVHESIQVHVASQQNSQKIPLYIVMIGNGNNVHELQDIGYTLQKDLQFTGQLEVTLSHKNEVSHQEYITPSVHKIYPLMVVVKKHTDCPSIEWWLYDTSNRHVIAHKTYDLPDRVVREWAHVLADQLWPYLVGQEGFFCTKIAYCKECVISQDAHKKTMKHIYIADYDGSYEQCLVKTPTINVAPRWNGDKKNPLLFYSECTNNNMRLIVTTMQGKRSIASNFEGINMLPSFSADGKEVVYCASRGTGNCQLYYCKKGVFKRITQNTGNNVSPSLSADGKKIFFCSDFQTGYPQIYCYDLITHEQICITDGSGYCAAPAFCSKSGLLVYSKIINGVMQLMLYNDATKQHSQLTLDAGNKQEASWSPCGNFILFHVHKGKSSKLALFNVTTKKYRFLTPGSAAYSYPHWSPRYERFPVVT